MEVVFFIIVESEYFHNGKKRELKFDISKYSRFKDKIIYIIQDVQPQGIEVLKPSDSKNIKSFKMIFNDFLYENSSRKLTENYPKNKLKTSKKPP